MASDIKVVCKNCGKSSPMEHFALDNVFRMIVCRNCTKDRRLRESVHAELAKQKEDKLAKAADEEDGKNPAGWDKDDELIERAYRQKVSQTVNVERIDDVKVRYSCPKCKYKFLYNTEKRTPVSCPYCGSGIAKIRL